MSWRHKDPEFDHEKFIEFLDGLIIGKMESMMADLTKLQADVDAQAPLIASLVAKVNAQAAKIADLEAQIAAATSADPQAPVDALDATVEANNAAITAAST